MIGRRRAVPGEHAFIVGAALAWAGVTRGRHLAYPAFHDVPVDELLSSEHAVRIADRIRSGQLPPPTSPSWTSSATARRDAHAHRLRRHRRRWHRLAPERPRVAHGPDPRSPQLLRAREGACQRRLAVRDPPAGNRGSSWGAPGGWSISSAVSQTISNLIDFGMSPVEAVDAPRLQSEGTPIHAELRVPQRTIEAMRARGMRVAVSLQKYERRFGQAQVALYEDGRFRGGSDPRAERRRRHRVVSPPRHGDRSGPASSYGAA